MSVSESDKPVVDAGHSGAGTSFFNTLSTTRGDQMREPAFATVDAVFDFRWQLGVSGVSVILFHVQHTGDKR